METLTVPQLAVPTAFEAMALVNRWLHREVGMAVHTTVAHFDATTFCWHLPIELAYATHGTLGVVGDVYLHAATGTFMGRPSAEELIRRAEVLAAARTLASTEAALDMDDAKGGSAAVRRVDIQRRNAYQRVVRDHDFRRNFPKILHWLWGEPEAGRIWNPGSPGC